MFFSVVIYECELDCKEGWVLKNWYFWTVLLEETPESLLSSKEIQPVHPEGEGSMGLKPALEVDDFGRCAEKEAGPLWFHEERLKCWNKPVEGHKPAWLEETVSPEGRMEHRAIQTLLEDPIFGLNQALSLNGSEPESYLSCWFQVAFNSQSVLLSACA